MSGPVPMDIAAAAAAAVAASNSLVMDVDPPANSRDHDHGLGPDGGLGAAAESGENGGGDGAPAAMDAYEEEHDARDYRSGGASPPLPQEQQQAPQHGTMLNGGHGTDGAGPGAHSSLPSPSPPPPLGVRATSPLPAMPALLPPLNKTWKAHEESLSPGTPAPLARVLTLLAGNPVALEFTAPVHELHPEIAGMYLQAVRRPIDLGKVLRRASAGVFSSASGLQRCRRHVHRVFSNAETFNQGSPQIIAIATHL